MNETRLNAILLTQLAATWFMVGLIWLVQIVHYPLFSRVGAANFSVYARRHQRLTTFVVAPPMIVELFCSALIVWARPASALAWIGAGLAAAIWLSTALVQVPMHGRLSGGFDARGHALLVRTNWLRTAAWSARGVLAIVMLATWWR